jgi:hypothetical protein
VSREDRAEGRRRRFGRVPLVVGIAARLFVLFVVVFTVSGGWQQLGRRFGPSENSPEVVAARRAGEAAMRSLAMDLVAGPVTEALGPEARQVGQPEATNHCEEGQHDWKIDTSYDLRCRVSVVTTMAGESVEFRQAMLDLHDRLSATGWSPAGTDIRQVVIDYWASFSQRSYPGSPSGDDRYTQADLPRAWYQYVDGAELVIDWTDATDPFEAAAALLDQHEYAITFTVGTFYFQR